MANFSIKPFYQGKVRDLYEVPGDPNSMVIVASDRVSAFDVVFDQVFSDKGKVLTQISNHWFKLLAEKVELAIPNHIIETDINRFPEDLRQAAEDWQGRAVWVRKLRRVDFECVVRGYIVGSGWKEYQKQGSVCGVPLPDGLKQAQKLPEPIFTPATKAQTGHDENVSFDYMANEIGLDLAKMLKEKSLNIYNWAAKRLESQGILLADTKFEFGLDENGGIVLIDEVLTPDSSRFWGEEDYQTGMSPPSYDKQILRDYLETLDWDKTPPPPTLAQEIIDRSMAQYREIEQKILNITS